MITLYKKDSKGKIRILILKTERDKLVQQAGLVTGKLVVNTRQCSPKNVGRANATTGKEQAVIEAEAIKVKKLKEGYFNTIDEAIASNVLMPMLATKCDLGALKYPVYIQPKLDGMRALGTSVSLISRKNRDIPTLSHINLGGLDAAVILDGEVYAHGLSFQENMKLIKKYREGETEKVKYHVYDLPSATGGFYERYSKLLQEVRGIKHVEVVPTQKVKDESELLKAHQGYISQGFEGTIVRLDGIPYEFNKRSKQLLKLKDFIDEVYEIIDVVPSDKIPEHGVVMCKMLDGQIFKCGMKLSHEERVEILKNKKEIIGKLAEVRFFEYTDGKLPRFPVYYGYRLDK